jgi:hypothetical protein
MLKKLSSDPPRRSSTRGLVLSAALADDDRAVELGPTPGGIDRGLIRGDGGGPLRFRGQGDPLREAFGAEDAKRLHRQQRGVGESVDSQEAQFGFASIVAFERELHDAAVHLTPAIDEVAAHDDGPVGVDVDGDADMESPHGLVGHERPGRRGAGVIAELRFDRVAACHRRPRFVWRRHGDGGVALSNQSEDRFED